MTRPCGGWGWCRCKERRLIAHGSQSEGGLDDSCDEAASDLARSTVPRRRPGRSIAYYQKIGFSFGEPWDGFYAIGHLDGLEVHLKEAPKNQAERQWRRDNEHLDAAAGVDGIEAFYEQCVANGVTIIKPLAATPWGTKDFYIEDPDGYVICFGGLPTGHVP